MSLNLTSIRDKIPYLVAAIAIIGAYMLIKRR